MGPFCVHSTNQGLRRAGRPTEKAASVYLAVKTLCLLCENICQKAICYHWRTHGKCKIDPQICTWQCYAWLLCSTLYYIYFGYFFFWCIKTVELKIPKILVAYKLIAWYLLWNDPVFRISVWFNSSDLISVTQVGSCEWYYCSFVPSQWKVRLKSLKSTSVRSATIF